MSYDWEVNNFGEAYCVKKHGEYHGLRKNGDYFHSFIVWDKDWNVVKYTDLFNFMGAKIEFSCGMCQHNNDIVITFGYQDNAAYVLRIPDDFFSRWLDV